MQWWEHRLKNHITPWTSMAHYLQCRFGEKSWGAESIRSIWMQFLYVPGSMVCFPLMSTINLGKRKRCYISDSPSMCSLVKTLQLRIRRWRQSEPAKSDDSSEPKEVVIDRNTSCHYFQNLIVSALIVLQNITPISLLQLFKWEDLQLLVCRCNDDKRSKRNILGVLDNWLD